MNIHNLDKLLPEEKDELRSLMQAYKSQFKADLLRSRAILGVKK